MVHLRNVSGAPLTLDGKTVGVDEVVQVKGDVSPDSPNDGHLIGDRIYPSALWSAEAAPSKKEKD